MNVEQDLLAAEEKETKIRQIKIKPKNIKKLVAFPPD